MPNLIMKPAMSKEFIEEVKSAVTAEWERHPEWGKYGRYNKSPQMQVRDVLDLLTESVISEWLAMHEAVISAKLEDIEKRTQELESMSCKLANCEAQINNAAESANKKLCETNKSANECLSRFNNTVEDYEHKLEDMKEEKKAVCGNERFAEIIGLYSRLIEVGKDAKATCDVSVREAAYITWAALGGDKGTIANAMFYDNKASNKTETDDRWQDATVFNPRRK